ncbi:hypothetical protein GW17_00049770 [Ensete ventricosum]|nr:hypothetical protein GW17_00049770 [Ensete ventricosum]RZS19492.1 hypothetical protein BHM03_00051887 [Ensete ventricosum]
MRSSRASGPTSGGCVSTNQMLSMQWSPNPSSSSKAYLFSLPLISSSPEPSPIVPMMWWSSSLSPLCPTSPLLSLHFPPPLRPSLLPLS